MPRSIYRYRLHADEIVTIDLPKNAQVLSVGPPRDNPDGPLDLWALVDLEVETESRTFRIYGTGHSIPDFHGLFIGTVRLFGGSLIFHVFEDVS